MKKNNESQQKKLSNETSATKTSKLILNTSQLHNSKTIPLEELTPLKFYKSRTYETQVYFRSLYYHELLKSNSPNRAIILSLLLTYIESICDKSGVIKKDITKTHLLDNAVKCGYLLKDEIKSANQRSRLWEDIEAQGLLEISESKSSFSCAKGEKLYKFTVQPIDSNEDKSNRLTWDDVKKYKSQSRQSGAYIKALIKHILDQSTVLNVRFISEATGLSDRQVNRYLSELVHNGEAIVETFDNNRKENKYISSDNLSILQKRYPELLGIKDPNFRENEFFEENPSKPLTEEGCSDLSTSDCITRFRKTNSVFHKTNSVFHKTNSVFHKTNSVSSNLQVTENTNENGSYRFYKDIIKINNKDHATEDDSKSVLKSESLNSNSGLKNHNDACQFYGDLTVENGGDYLISTDDHYIKPPNYKKNHQAQDVDNRPKLKINIEELNTNNARYQNHNPELIGKSDTLTQEEVLIEYKLNQELKNKAPIKNESREQEKENEKAVAHACIAQLKEKIQNKKLTDSYQLKSHSPTKPSYTKQKKKVKRQLRENNLTPVEQAEKILKLLHAEHSYKKIEALYLNLESTVSVMVLRDQLHELKSIYGTQIYKIFLIEKESKYKNDFNSKADKIRSIVDNAIRDVENQRFIFPEKTMSSSEVLVEPNSVDKTPELQVEPNRKTEVAHEPEIIQEVHVKQADHDDDKFSECLSILKELKTSKDNDLFFKFDRLIIGFMINNEPEKIKSISESDPYHALNDTKKHIITELINTALAEIREKPQKKFSMLLKPEADKSVGGRENAPKELSDDKLIKEMVKLPKPIEGEALYVIDSVFKQLSDTSLSQNKQVLLAKEFSKVLSGMFYKHQDININSVFDLPSYERLALNENKFLKTNEPIYLWVSKSLVHYLDRIITEDNLYSNTVDKRLVNHVDMCLNTLEKEVRKNDKFSRATLNNIDEKSERAIV